MRPVPRTRTFFTPSDDKEECVRTLVAALEELENDERVKAIYGFEGKFNYGNWTIFIRYSELMENGWED